MNDVLIETHVLTVYYGHQRGIRHVGLSVKQGDVFGLDCGGLASSERLCFITPYKAVMLFATMFHPFVNLGKYVHSHD